MSVFGIGVDVVQISRIEAILLRKGERFASRILGRSEQLILLSRRRRLASFLAGRIAAKEATMKALGIGMARGLSFPKLEILNDDAGRPVLRMSEEVRRLAETLGAGRFSVSLSDERTHACAIVICEHVIRRPEEPRSG